MSNPFLSEATLGRILPSDDFCKSRSRRGVLLAKETAKLKCRGYKAEGAEGGSGRGKKQLVLGACIRCQT